MTDRREAPDVEPLSQIAWQRVERDLFAALDCDAAVVAPPPRLRTWAPWALAGSFAAAAATLVLVLLSGHDGGAPRSDAPRSDGLASASTPSRVVTQQAGSEISFGDAMITVGPASAVTMHGDATRGVLILLERGEASFAVAPRAGRPPFIVEAGEVSVRVVGTRFTVSRSGESARVDVTEGHVEVVSRGHRAQVLAGESWSSVDDREAVDRHTPDPDELAAAPFVDEPEPVAEDPGPAHVTPKAKPKATPAPDQRALYEHAAALEATDARAALAEYTALARRKGPWAANAMYAAGRLAAELGERDLAIKLLNSYLTKFPKGGNAADARAMIESLGG